MCIGFLLISFRCKATNVPCKKNAGHGQACLSCNWDKQRCEGMQWVGTPGGLSEELLREFVDFRKEFVAFCLDFIKCMDWVAKQIADVADANNQYFVWKM